MIGKTRQAGQVRGVLRQRLEAGEFQHARRRPSPALADFVEHYWQVDWDLRGLPPQQQETLPHPSVHLVVEPALAALYGVHTGRFVRRLQGRGYAFGIKFAPGGFQPFLGGPVSALLNRSRPIAATFGEASGEWVGAVRAAADIDARAELAETFLRARRPERDERAVQAARHVAAIADDAGITSVEALAARGGLGKRALQRLFQHYVGVGPKWVINRYRMHEAIARVQAGAAVDWADLALELGYFDQAHFNRDFRALVGLTPGEYARREQRPGVHPGEAER